MKTEQGEQELNLDKKEKYIDANLFITAATSEKEKGNNARMLIKEIEKRNIKAFTATLTIDEILWAIQKIKNRETAYLAAKLITTIPNLEFIPIDQNIIAHAIEIYNKNELRPREAIHLAAMKQKNISTIISSDPDFDKIKGIRRIDFTK